MARMSIAWSARSLKMAAAAAVGARDELRATARRTVRPHGAGAASRGPRAESAPRAFTDKVLSRRHRLWPLHS